FDPPACRPKHAHVLVREYPFPGHAVPTVGRHGYAMMVLFALGTCGLCVLQSSNIAVCMAEHSAPLSDTPAPLRCLHPGLASTSGRAQQRHCSHRPASTSKGCGRRFGKKPPGETHVLAPKGPV